MSQARERDRFFLSGIRVVDLSMGWSGPLAARHLADMGAEVIKVEACGHLDWWRGWDLTAERIEERMYEQAPAFNLMNRNKLGITLDLSNPRGAELLLRLVGVSDVVVENHSATVLPRLGLDYPRLRRENPRIIMVSLPAFGLTGPWRGYRAYGSTVEQASGIPQLTGEPDWPPAMQHVAYGDPVAGLNAAAAVLLALYHRERTGEGQRIDLSQVECLFPLAAHGIISQSANGEPPERRGNRHPVFAPHGVYPCAGEDRWVAITVMDDAQWASLCRVMGRPDLAGDGSLATAAGRKNREAWLDRQIAAWSRKRDPDETMVELQEAGVPSAAVKSAYQLLQEPHLTERGFLEWVERKYVGVQPCSRAPYRASRGLRGVERPAPCLGEHNREVLCGLLGLSEEDISELESEGIIGDAPAAGAAEASEI